jgi:hypothetical protein
MFTIHIQRTKEAPVSNLQEGETSLIPILQLVKTPKETLTI